MVIAIIVCFILAIFGIKNEHTFFNLQTVFCIVWGCICYAASFQLYGMNSLSENIYLVVILGCLGFTLGYFSISTTIRTNIYNKKSLTFTEIDDKWFNSIFWICFVFMIFFTVKTVGLLIAGVPYSHIRDIFGSYGLEDSMLTSKFETYIQDFILNASVPVYLALAVLHILKVVKLSTPQLLKITLLVIAYVFVSGSRITLTNAIIQLIIVYFMFHLKLSKKTLKRLTVVLILLFVGISIITDNRNRSGTQEGKYYTYYTYGTLALPMCEYYMKKADNNNDRTYGAMVTSGIANCIVRPLSIIGLPRPSFLQTPDKYNNLINEYIEIFDYSHNNAYVSTFFYFYLDFGWGGIFFMSVFFGWLLKLFYIRAIRKSDVRTILFFTVLLVSFTKSFMRWEFIKTSYVLSFLYVILFTKKNHGLSKIH